MAEGADPPAGLIRRDHIALAHLLAQGGVGRRGVTRGAVQQVGETARRHRQPERGPQKRATFPNGMPNSVCNSTTSAATPGPSCAPAAPQRIRSLQRMPALHPPLTLRAVADLDIEAPHDGAYHRQVFLILRLDARHGDGAAAIRTRRRDRRRKRLVDTGRTTAAGFLAVVRTGAAAGTPTASLRSVLGEGGSLPEPGATRRRQLLLQVVDLTLLPLVLTFQAVDPALLALVPSLLGPRPRARTASTPRAAARSLRASVESTQRRTLA